MPFARIRNQGGNGFGSSSASPAGWTPPWRRRSSTGPSATSSTCVSWDNGACSGSARGDQVMAAFADNLGVTVLRVDAEERFLPRPGRRGGPGEEAEDHRRPFSWISSRRSRRGSRTPAGWPRGPSTRNVIESAGAKTGKAHNIKSHPQRGGAAGVHEAQAPGTAAGTVQGRGAAIGEELGLPHQMVWRHPSPDRGSESGSSGR